MYLDRGFYYRFIEICVLCWYKISQEKKFVILPLLLLFLIPARPLPPPPSLVKMKNYIKTNNQTYRLWWMPLAHWMNYCELRMTCLKYKGYGCCGYNRYCVVYLGLLFLLIFLLLLFILLLLSLRWKMLLKQTTKHTIYNRCRWHIGWTTTNLYKYWPALYILSLLL